MFAPEFYMVESSALIRPEFAETLSDAADLIEGLHKDFPEETHEILACVSLIYIEPDPKPRPKV